MHDFDGLPESGNVRGVFYERSVMLFCKALRCA